MCRVHTRCISLCISCGAVVGSDVVHSECTSFFLRHGMKTALYIILLFLYVQLVFSAEIIGKVVGISDGDTITIIDTSNSRYRIRLDRIDAPERRQPFGEKSKQYLSSLIFGKQVKIEYQKKDRYGRILGVVFCGDKEINLLMVQHGMAWHYSYYDKTEHYAVAEREARRKKIGLWGDPNPVNPYDFRKRKRTQK